MSQVLKNIQNEISTVVSEMDKIPESINNAKSGIDLLQQSTSSLVDVFFQAKDSIVSMTKEIDSKAKSIDKVNKSISGVSKTSGGAASEMHQLAQATGRLLGNFGTIPRYIGQTITGVSQMSVGIAAASTKAGKLAAMLGPVTLVSTAVMGIIQAISLFRRSRTEVEELTDSFDVLLSRADRMQGESARLSGYLIENIRLMEHMVSIGTSDVQLSMLESQNGLIREQIRLNNIREGNARQRGLEDIMSQLTQQEVIGQEREGLAFWERINPAWTVARGEYKSLSEQGLLGANIYADSLIMHVQNRLDNWDGISLEDKIKFNGEYIELEDVLSQFSEWATLLRVCDEEQRAMSYTLQGIITQFNNIVDPLNNAAHSMNYVEGELYELAIAYQEASAQAAKLTKEAEEAMWFGGAYAEMLHQQAQAARKTANELNYLLTYQERAEQRQQKRDNAGQAVNDRIQNDPLRNYRDAYAAADKMRESITALSAAQDATYGITIDHFNTLMNLSPGYMQFLYDEEGALRCSEEAAQMAAHAQIELMGVRQANAVLDQAEQFFNEAGSLYGFATATDVAADSLWGLVEARKALLLADADADYDTIGAITQQIQRIRELTESAQLGATRSGALRGGSANTPYGGATKVQTPAGQALLVSDPANRDIKDEFKRLFVDISKHRYATDVYQQRQTPASSVTFSPGAIQVNALPGMDIEQIAQHCAMRVAQQCEKAFKNDLKRVGGYSYGGVVG